MNTTSRIESSGEGGKIHLSSETAAILKAEGMESWVVPRKNRVDAKGKGLLNTYWLVAPKEASTKQSLPCVRIQVDDSESERDGTWNLHGKVVPDDKAERLIQWNTDTLLGLLQNVAARRMARRKLDESYNYRSGCDQSSGTLTQNDTAPIDEVKEIIELPAFDRKVEKLQPSPEAVQLHEGVASQLREYVARIASMYNQNPFHNFEHVSSLHFASILNLTLTLKT